MNAAQLQPVTGAASRRRGTCSSLTGWLVLALIAPAIGCGGSQRYVYDTAVDGRQDDAATPDQDKLELVERLARLRVGGEKVVREDAIRGGALDLGRKA